MSRLDRHLLRDFTQSFLATLMVLLVVSLGGVMADLLGKIAEGRIPATLMLSQLGLQLLNYLPLILPMALMLGLMLAFARMYRDSEMPVLASVGVGPGRLLRPLLAVVLPVVVVVGLLSLWLGPWAQRTGQEMIANANKSLVVAGFDAGKFTTLPNGSVIYVGGISGEGTHIERVFVQRQTEDRLDVVTAQGGDMFFEGDTDRYLRLNKGFRVEGPLDDGLDYRLMRFAQNELALPDREDVRDATDPEMLPTPALLGDPRPEANAQLHARITPPLLALAFALLALPLARSLPRQGRYGRIMLGFMGYLVGTLLMINGTQALADGKLPPAAGLWWLSLPLLALAVWWYAHDGRLSRPRGKAAT
ncbi:LPS export ABC transporter permease LptF [Pseudoxanthomonas kalamensis DSM 18571]|uniref:LPS export ABC transporter permease LptF n=1 Tax=Pseudoxanthomonas kalamensis TaxID=289483 RepID=UPI0013918656|nr:LPS export ABC transporter permease LptF [Pseudoxanthomonas kalamensis]KAF1708887.1 LPS export ABC transporter permease LptF [Pseudoxanthomonas kalamensis DSM 18571]